MGSVCTYDANGRVSRRTLVDGAVRTYAYTLDNQGNVKSSDVTDPRGTLIKKTFNSAGYTLTDTLVSGRDQQKVTFDRQTGTNLVTRFTDALGRKTNYTYDGCGNTALVTRLAGTQQAVTTSFTYQSGATCIATYNQPLSVTDPLNHTTSFGYDTKGNLTTITAPLNRQTTLIYNTQGQPTSITDPVQKTWQLAYDYGDLTRITDPLQRASTRVVDFAGRLASVANPPGMTNYYEYDALNRLVKVTDPLLGVTEFGYDPNGNLLSVKDACSGLTSYAYNNMDRLQTRTDALLKAES